MKNSDIVVDRNKLNHYKIKLTLNSPVHIGTGDVYEPTNYIVDNNRLYAFDEVLFYNALTQMEKNSLQAKMDDYMQIIDFYKSKIELAKELAYFDCPVSRRVQEQFNKKYNKNGSKNNNQLNIDKTFSNPNTHRAVIPGSSIKGMLETAMKIHVKCDNSSNEVRQNLIISDAMLVSGGVEIGYANRRHRDSSKSSKDGIYQIIEVIKPNSSFIFTLDTNKSFDSIKASMKKYHDKRYNSRYKESETRFMAKMGKNVAMDYMVDVENVNNLQNRDKRPLATHFLYSSDKLHDEEFGWITLELIDDNSYNKELELMAQEEKLYYEDVSLRQKKIREKIKKEKTERKEKALKKLADERAEADKKAIYKAEREAKLSAMDPLDKLIDSYNNDEAEVVNAMKANEIDNLEAIKVELATKLKTMMQKEPKKWDKAKKKALIRKEYIQAILGE